MLHVTGNITINYDIRQIWDYINGGIAYLPDTVNQQQLKNWFKGMGPWGHQVTQQHKEATYLSYLGKQQEYHLLTQFNCIISLEALD